MKKIIKYLVVYGICWILVVNCGHSFQGSGGWKEDPASGGHMFEKIDVVDPENRLMEPEVLPRVAGAHQTAPAIVQVGHEYYLWYSFEKTNAIAIEFTSSPDRTSFTRRDESKETINNGTVLWATESWEGNFVEAPAVIYEEGTFKMWYEGGDSAGIGYATSSDGINWTKEALPVLTPGEAWEGGTVGNPTVISDPYGSADQRYKMWYDANTGTGSGIGYATSPDGLRWTKRDANGRFDDQTTSSDDDNVVAQVLWPDDDPENPYGLFEFDPGGVSAPFVIVYKSTTGSVIYKMWYAGETSDEDMNIGYAASLDGVNWEKQYYNPVVYEEYLAQASLLPLFGYMLETDPMVLYSWEGHTGANYYMFFAQMGENDKTVFYQSTPYFIATAKSPPGGHR